MVFVLARGALHPGKAGNHTPGLIEEARRGGKREGERACSRERGARSHPPPLKSHAGWRRLGGGLTDREEQSEGNRSVDRSTGDARQRTRGIKRLTSAQSRCILWVERRQSSTVPVRCVTTEAGFLFVRVCTGIGHLLICPRLGRGTEDPRRYPITRPLLQPDHSRQPAKVHRRARRCSRRRPCA